MELLESGYYYHIYNHANGNKNLFLEEDNYIFFLNKYYKFIDPIADTFAYCLMPNHLACPAGRFSFFIKNKR